MIDFSNIPITEVKRAPALEDSRVEAVVFIGGRRCGKTARMMVDWDLARAGGDYSAIVFASARSHGVMHLQCMIVEAPSA